ncbi:MAG TPA: hypothetical protein VIM70_20620 [Clostridium sp.]|uniref:hypothetical protein n=1 Tax=Clostridium sp. TaxID=1506 RepID=UPI002F9281C1
MQDQGTTTTATTKIFIIGDENQSVNLDSCELDANVYIPMGSYSSKGGRSSYMFQGSCVASSVNIQGNIKLNYLITDISKTPLKVLNNTQPVTTNWVMDKWDN